MSETSAALSNGQDRPKAVVTSRTFVVETGPQPVTRLLGAERIPWRAESAESQR